MTTKIFLIIIGVFLFFQNNLVAQENYREQMQQDFENFKRDREKAFSDFKEKREAELKKMEQAYQDYYNQLFSLKNYYAENNDTTSANIVDEIIEFENTICKTVSKQIEVTELVNVDKEKSIDVNAEKQTTRYSDEPLPEKEPTEKIEKSEIEETTFVPLVEEGNSVPVMGPLPRSKTRITSPFGMRNHPTLNRRKMHNGIDFGSGMNTPVFAAADGKVTLAQYSRSFGNWIIIEHSNGYVTIYAHLNSFNTKVGAFVSKGNIIGYTGNTGRSSGAHLHYEIRLDGTPINPAGYLTELIE